MYAEGTTRLSFVHRLRDRHDGNGWAEFHKRYGELLYSYARRLGASHDDAEDIVQEVEMYLFKAMGGFQHFARKGCFRAYLRTAVTHATGRKASKQARQGIDLNPGAAEMLADSDPCHDAVWEREERLHRVRWAMRLIAGEFEPLTLEAFRMHVLAGESVADTAKQLGINKDSVYQAKSRILRRLKVRIDSLDLEADV